MIDPTSMRFEGRVSADKIGTVKVGQPVKFRINGYGDQQFTGVVKRIDPSANDVTRQVEVLVGSPTGEQPRVAGLYAEGRIDAESVERADAAGKRLVQAGDKTYAWRVKGSTLTKVDLAIGARDPRTGNIEIKAGLAAGDTVLRASELEPEGWPEGRLTGAAGGQRRRSPARPRRKQRELSHVPVRFQCQEADRDDRADPGDDVPWACWPCTSCASTRIPDVEIPVIVVNIPYPGASPETVEREIINRLEKSLQSIPGVSPDCTSTSAKAPPRSSCSLRLRART